MTFYEINTVYVPDNPMGVFECDGSGDSEKIVRYWPIGASEDWLLRVANEGWTTQQFLMYFPRGDLKKVSGPPQQQERIQT